MQKIERGRWNHAYRLKLYIRKSFLQKELYTKIKSTQISIKHCIINAKRTNYSAGRSWFKLKYLAATKLK